LDNGHSTIFIRWDDGFDASREYNGYWCLGGNQDDGRVGITRHAVSDQKRFSVYWKDDLAVPTLNLDGFGDTSPIIW
jgi:hypothetical protein